MKFKSFRFYLAGLVWLILVLILVACGDDSSRHFNPPDPAPQLPPGQYLTVLTDNDISYHPLVPPAYGTTGKFSSPYTGVWGLNLDKDNHYTIIFNNETLVEGTYQLTSDKISFASSPSAGSFSACPSADSNPGDEAIYNWNLTGNILVLTQIFDDCIVRGLVLPMHPLKRTDLQAVFSENPGHVASAAFQDAALSRVIHVN